MCEIPNEVEKVMTLDEASWETVQALTNGKLDMSQYLFLAWHSVRS